jgi:hypothetical protein
MSDSPLDLADAHHDELHRLLRLYHSEARRCRDAKACLAGCVMAGAVLETSLVLIVSLFQDDVRTVADLSTKHGGIKPLMEWWFRDLLDVAKANGWLPAGLDYGVDDWSDEKAKAGDYAEVVREMRDLAHPARYLQDFYRRRVTRDRFELVLESVELANGWLLGRIGEVFAEQETAEQEKTPERHASARTS